MAYLYVFLSRTREGQAVEWAGAATSDDAARRIARRWLAGFYGPDAADVLDSGELRRFDVPDAGRVADELMALDGYEALAHLERLVTEWRP